MSPDKQNTHSFYTHSLLACVAALPYTHRSLSLRFSLCSVRPSPLPLLLAQQNDQVDVLSWVEEPLVSSRLCARRNLEFKSFSSNV